MIKDLKNELNDSDCLKKVEFKLGKAFLTILPGKEKSYEDFKTDFMYFTTIHLEERLNEDILYFSYSWFSQRGYIIKISSVKTLNIFDRMFTYIFIKILFFLKGLEEK